MNIDIIEPRNRVTLPVSGSKATSILHLLKRHLFVGLNNGDILMYKAAKTTKDDSGYVLQNTFSNVSKDNSPIEKLHGLPISNEFKEVLVVTTIEFIRVMEISGTSINIIHEFPNSRNSYGTTVINIGGKQLFVFSSKKKVYIFRMKVIHNTLLFTQLSEIPFKDKIKSIALYPDERYLLVALVSELLLVKLSTFEVEPLPVDETSLTNFTSSTSFSYFSLSSSEPSTWILPLSRLQLLLVKDTLIVTLELDLELQGATEQPNIIQSPIKLSAVPLFVSFISPLYLLIVYNKRLEILDYETGDLIQKITHQFNSAQLLVSHVGSSIFITSPGQNVLQFHILGHQKQIDQYLSISGKESSTGNIKDPKNDLKVIGLDKSISLVTKLESNEGFFGTVEADTEKRKQLVLRELYRKKAILLFESYSKYHESLVEISSEWLVPYRDMFSLFPDFIDGELKIIGQGDFPNIEEAISVRSFSHNIVKRISLSDIQNTKLISTDSGTDYDKSTINQTSSQSIAPNRGGFSKSQNVRKFIKAVNNLIIYLTDQRRIHLTFVRDVNSKLSWKDVELTAFDIYPWLTLEKLSSQINHIALVIDTTLFLCYFYTKPMMLGPLLRLPNNQCNAKVVNECLLNNIHPSMLHQSNQFQFHQQTNFIKELLDFYFGRGLHKDSLEMLYKLSHNEEDQVAPVPDNEFANFVKGPDLTIQYLTKLSNDELELIFEFSVWVIMEGDKGLEVGESIFMNESYECENYDSLQVLNFFQNVLKVEALAIRYLEWLVLESDLIEKFTKNNTLSKFHTKLCLLYLDKLKEIEKEYDGEKEEEFYKTEYYVKLFNFLKETNLYEPWTLLKNIPTNHDKYLRFTVFVYRRLGEHEKSVDVLYNQLNDLDSAMEYCSDIHKSDSTIGESLLHKLLEDLLMDYEENVLQIEKLLVLQGSKMSIFKILLNLPNSFPLNKLEKFLFANLRDTQECLHDSRIASKLHQIGNFKSQEKIWSIQAKSYTIESSRKLCGICNRRLGYSVFSVEDEKVVHYVCAQRR